MEEVKKLGARNQVRPLEGGDLVRYRQLLALLVQQIRHGHDDERRRRLRIRGSVEVQFRHGPVVLTCTALDLSLGGLLLEGVLLEFVEGREVEVVNLRVGGQDFPLHAPARTVWHVAADDRPRAGLEFLELGSDDRRQIQSAFERLLIQEVERQAGG